MPRSRHARPVAEACANVDYFDSLADLATWARTLRAPHDEYSAAPPAPLPTALLRDDDPHRGKVLVCHDYKVNCNVLRESPGRSARCADTFVRAHREGIPSAQETNERTPSSTSARSIRSSSAYQLQRGKVSGKFRPAQRKV